MTCDDDEEVRSNAVFALGVLSVNGGEAMIRQVLQQGGFCVHYTGRI